MLLMFTQLTEIYIFISSDVRKEACSELQKQAVNRI